MAKKSSETEEQRQERLSKQRKRPRKNSVRNNSLIFNSSENVIPKTGNLGENTNSGTRALRVSRRFSILNLLEDDIGKATALRERVQSMQIVDTEHVIFTLIAQNGKTAKIFLEETFFAKAPFYIDTWLRNSANILESGVPVTLNCVGEVVLRDNKLSLLVMAEAHLRLNDMSLPNFIMHFRKNE